MPDTQHRSYSDNVVLHTQRVSAFAPESPVLVCFLLYHLLVSFLPNISLPFHKYSLLLITTKCQYIFSDIIDSHFNNFGSDTPHDIVLRFNIFGSSTPTYIVPHFNDFGSGTPK